MRYTSIAVWNSAHAHSRNRAKVFESRTEELIFSDALVVSRDGTESTHELQFITF